MFIAFCASAATSITTPVLGEIEFTGDIMPGDAEKIISVILEKKPFYNNDYLYPFQLSINSRGGDLNEAKKIALFIKATHLRVNVLSQGICASSCFYVFLAGLNRNASGLDSIKIDGSKNSQGAIGIHRLYYSKTKDGPIFAERQEVMMEDAREYLRLEKLPQYIVDEMMSRPSNDIYWLKQRDIDAVGPYNPGLEEQLIAKCGYNRKIEANLTLTGKEFIRYTGPGGVGRCVSEYIFNTYNSLRETAFARMRQGWRPWR